MRRWLVILLISTFAACSGGGLEGVYTCNADGSDGMGTLSINFRNDGTCIYQLELFGVRADYEGTYSVSGREVTVKHDGAKSEQVYKMTGDGALIGPGAGRYEKQ